MTKGGPSKSTTGSKQGRAQFDEDFDDDIPIALAHRLRKEIREDTTAIGGDDVRAPTRNKKENTLYLRSIHWAYRLSCVCVCGSSGSLS
ncbi:hypothetical protein AAHA92_33716 [Salvia divinorum]|uniref:Uncharacterized protein n=1 Tax=Salvia divinorum TaxID=28513 RepID=A0ABD1FQX6_SALDI